MKGKRHLIDTAFVITLFGMYAAAAFMVLALGINSYKKSAASYETHYNCRTSLLYIAEKIRQNDEAGKISLTESQVGEAIVISGEAEGFEYETWIFFTGNTLREATVARGITPLEDDGWAILTVEDFDISSRGNTLIITQKESGGGSYSLRINTKCGFKGEAGYE
ncbi:MAG: DUF4860 domain-containing protein [Eubacteriaceae bacterium]|nr:DUF4860 domain-containing protein [Eubacteriaceae bacterium]